jgi:hypothetical protein
MPLVAFRLRHFSADFIICTCELISDRHNGSPWMILGRRLRKPDVTRLAGELATFQRMREQRDKGRRQKEHLISCCDRRQ